MTKNIVDRRNLAVAAIAIGLAGCASVAVTDDAIQRETATSLSVAPGTFQISNRQNSGVKTTYDVKLSDGRQYACYVTGGVGITGRVVSDPVCQPANTTASAATKPTAVATPAACNALLKAAGKC